MSSKNSKVEFTLGDDLFHPHDDHPWFTETAWYSFNVPERKLGGWIHGSVRPNLGVCTSYIFLWDDSAVNPWELPYYHAQYSQPLPKERDLRSFQWPHGQKVEMLEPAKSYRIRFRDRDLLDLDLRFDGICEPHPFGHGDPPFIESHHYDQPGRVRGEITLRDERLEIDCLSVRDRSWGPRIDHRGGRIGYSFGTASENSGFCVFVRPQEIQPDGGERVTHGYWLHEGMKSQITHGSRVVRRNRQGWIQSIELECVDDQGRILRSIGRGISRMIFPVGQSICMNTLLEWRIGEVTAFGEDQDMWRFDQWSLASRRHFTDS